MNGGTIILPGIKRNNFFPGLVPCRSDDIDQIFIFLDINHNRGIFRLRVLDQSWNKIRGGFAFSGGGYYENMLLALLPAQLPPEYIPVGSSGKTDSFSIPPAKRKHLHPFNRLFEIK